jgi:hypothetical protein
LAAAQSPASLGLEFEFQMHGMLKPPVEIGAGPYGTRRYFEVTEGKVTGERISGRVLSGGGDWILIGPDGWGRLDVRGQIATEDGAFIFASYFGILERNDAVQQAVQTGAETAYGDQYFRIAPRLQTGDPRYAWVNQTLFVGEGRIYPGRGVEYRVCRVT